MHAATAKPITGSSPAPERPAPLADLRDALLAPLRGRSFAFEITAREDGVLAGSRRLAERAREIGLQLDWLAADGVRLAPGAPLCRARGDAWQVARAEELLLAAVGKASGVATAAAALVALAGGRARVVCGAWKKVPVEVRAELREAVAAGGAGLRILDVPFVYLDKNHVRMLGGVVAAVRQARRLGGRAVVVQLRGETAPIADEAAAAVAERADLLVVDTGEVADLRAVVRRIAAGGERAVAVGFGGGVDAARLGAVVEAGAAVVDVGRAIVDAPLLDLRLDVR
jgi:nicotinate-nucleotide pyrophosphorylase (carboxylating)